LESFAFVLGFSFIPHTTSINSFSNMNHCSGRESKNKKCKRRVVLAK
jgi:hypothetical protein